MDALDTYPELSDRSMRGATDLDFLKTGVNKGLNAFVAKTARIFAFEYDPSIDVTEFHLFAHLKLLRIDLSIPLTNVLFVQA